MYNAKLKCDLCSGYYEEMELRYGTVFRCSNYPDCKSYKDIIEYIAEYICVYGIAYYKWDKPCCKCGDTTTDYAYFLSYELAAAEIEYFDESCFSYDFKYKGDDHLINTSYAINSLLSKKEPTFKKFYCKKYQTYYFANTCKHCGNFQPKESGFIMPRHEVPLILIDRKIEDYYFDRLICPEKWRSDFKSLLISDLLVDN